MATRRETYLKLVNMYEKFNSRENQKKLEDSDSRAAKIAKKLEATSSNR